MLIIALVVLLAFIGVLIPLMRRRPAVGDEREFDAGPRPADSSPVVAPMAAGPATPGARLGEAPDAPGGDVPMSEDDLEREVLRYRTALRAGTLCRKCGQANPADSRFCFECGSRLPLTDAKEFA